MITIQGWMKHIQGLQTELTENKELLTKMQNDNADLKVSASPENVSYSSL